MDTRRRSSLPTRGAWIEMHRYQQSQYIAASLPTRGAWIEISDITHNAAK